MNHRQGRITLASSGPIAASADGELIENLDIEAKGSSPGIAVIDRAYVRIRNCRIHHTDGPGINAVGAKFLIIEDCQIVCASAPPAGPLATFETVNVRIDGGEQITIRRVRAERGASGVYAHKCFGIHVSMLEGYDFRGPFPRGQLVQFDKCQRALLEDFSCSNSGTASWPEDNVNCFHCIDPVIRRGFIHGNNSPSGIGVIVEGGEGGLVQDVDVVYWANGAFSAADGARGVVFERCRARDGLGPAASSTSLSRLDYRDQPMPSLEAWLGGQDRGRPLSGQEAFFAYRVSEPNIVFRDCSYANLPSAPNVAWGQDRMEVAEFKEVDFTPRAGPALALPWSTDVAPKDVEEPRAPGSRIDPSKPADGLPASKADLRRNLLAAKEEIEALQQGVSALRVVTADHRLEPADFGRMIVADSPRPITIVCSKDMSAPSGSARTLKVARRGAGPVRFTAESGFELLSPGGRLTIAERNGVATLHVLNGLTAVLEGV